VPAPDADVTRLLLDLSGGDREAMDRLLPAIYGELRRIAQERLYREREGHTLSTTDLVHEAYLRLVDVTRVQWRDRAHFYAAAAGVMRRLLVDWARARHAAKRGGAADAVSLDALAGEGPAAPARPEELLALDEALDHLRARSERQARVVECRYFAGLSIEETAEALGISPTTVKDDWRIARAWLYRALRTALPS
jgi:RNA polymerase sigma factor (TIGR02999 family)